MINKSLIAFSFSLISVGLQAQQNQLVVIGGGGESTTNIRTQFDRSIDYVGDFFQKNKKSYRSLINFNGGHIESEQMIKKKYSDGKIIEGFSSQNFNKVMAETFEKINSMPAGSKMLIFINSHGAEKTTEKTHSIATSGTALLDLNAGDSTALVSLDKLAELSKVAERNNIKLAVIDGSCHSGNTLSVANSNTCVITASGPDHYAFSDFADNFAERMQTGKNLEEIFLETRRVASPLSFPMISSPAGLSTNESIYPYLTPYLYFHDEYNGLPMDKIDTYIKNNSRRSLVCERNKEFDKLEEVLYLIRDVDRISRSNTDLTNLLNKLRDYKNAQDEYLEDLIALELPSLETKELISTPDFKTGNYYTHKELLAKDYSVFARENEEILKNNKNLSEKEAGDLERMRKFFLEAQKVKLELVKKYPQYAEQAKIIAKLKTDKRVSIQIASDIAKLTQNAYTKLYEKKQKELQNKMDTTPNPCKDFVL